MPPIHVPACGEELQVLKVSNKMLLELMINPVYNTSVPPNIATITPTIPTRTQTSLDATLAAARALPHHLNPLLNRIEGHASSAIENLHTDLRTLSVATLNTHNDHNTHVIHDNVTALDANPADHQATQRTITHRTLRKPGITRTDAVWIGGLIPQYATFVPPHHTHVPDALTDLTTFTARTDLHPIIHAAITHAQFETIHPYPDGNGRSGRALITHLLTRDGLPPLPLSTHLATHKPDYYAALSTYRDGNAAPITALLAAAIRATTTTLTTADKKLTTLHHQWATKADTNDPTIHAILNTLLHTPALTATSTATTQQVTRPAAQKAINTLADHNIVHLTDIQTRNRIYLAPEALRIHQKLTWNPTSNKPEPTR